MTSTPYWPRPVERYLGRLPERADILVIGGGITGTSLLHHLRARGMNGVLVERAHIASGASGRNAGFLLAGVADNYADAVRAYGRSRARTIWQMTLENHDTMIEAVAGQDVDHRRLGSATLASGEEEAESLAESAQLLSEDGFEAGWDGRRLINPRDGEVNPASTVGALARLAKAGAIREGVNVTAVEASSSDVLVHADGAECRAGCVILATNAYTPLLLPQIAIQPRRAQMLASGPDASHLCDLPHMCRFQRPRHGFRVRQREEARRLALGSGSDLSRNSIQFSPMMPSTWATLKCLRSIPRSSLSSCKSLMGPYLESMPPSRSVPRPTCSGPPVARAWWRAWRTTSFRLVLPFGRR
ncbi:MAG: FAD-binding oxidoreductase [Chloroflexi bacterium]|nr:MAG: FAD-binding oxidoreductase [Chloroflexota bacterium]